MITDIPTPAAQALVKAFDDRYELLGPLEENWQEVCLAAAIRELAEQVTPAENPPADFLDHPLAAEIDQRRSTRSQLLAIAAELEV